jgi:hypothetical protein
MPPLTGTGNRMCTLRTPLFARGLASCCTAQGPFLVKTRNMLGFPVSFLAYRPLSAPPGVAPAQGYLRTIVQWSKSSLSFALRHGHLLSARNAQDLPCV